MTSREKAPDQALPAQISTEQWSGAGLTTQFKDERDMLAAIIENTDTQLAYLDTEFNFVWVNSAYAQGTGKKREELIGKNHFALFPNAENQSIFEGVRNTGATASFSAKPFVYADRPELGTTYWDWTLVPTKDDAGRVEGLVLSLHDVTERQRAEAEIVSMTRFPSENPHPVMRIAADGVLVYANPGSKPVLETWNTRIGQKVPPRWQDHVREANRTHSVGSAEMVCDRRVYSLTIAPSSDGYANLYGMEVTDLRRVQSSLRQYASRLRTLHQIDQRILAAQSVEEIARAALARVPQMIDCLRASVMLFDFETHEVSLLAAYTAGSQSHTDEGWRATLTREWAVLVQNLQRGEHVVVEDIEGLPPDSPLMATERATGIRTLLLQPLLVKDTLLGALTLGLAGPGRVATQSIGLANELAVQLAIAIQQARLHQQVQDRAEDLERRVAWRTAALRISEARFRAIFEDAPVGIALLDDRGRIIQNNTAMATILHRDDAELRETSLFSYMNQADVGTGSTMFEDLMSGTSEEYHTDIRFNRSDGQILWCNVTISLVRDVAQRPRLAVGMVEDITDRREAQAAMVQNEKLALTGQLAASFAHEINNPLQTVIGCLGLADESLREQDILANPNGDSISLYMQMASEELKRAAGIVGRLRDLNRQSTPDEREYQSIRALIDEALSIAHKQARDRGILVEISEEPNLPKLLVVPDRLQQVFLNLMLNAIDAMPDGGTLTVLITKTNDPAGVRTILRDTGSGIPPEVQASLFDPFQTTKPEGLGLGLFISQAIVKDLGGDIRVESGPREGTSFTVWLPA